MNVLEEKEAQLRWFGDTNLTGGMEDQRGDSWICCHQQIEAGGKVRKEDDVNR